MKLKFIDMHKCYRRIISVIAILLLVSCSASNIVVNYQTKREKGAMIIIPNVPIKNATVTVNDSVLIKDKNISKLTINNLRDGDYVVKCNAISSDGKPVVTIYYFTIIDGHIQNKQYHEERK